MQTFSEERTEKAASSQAICASTDGPIATCPPSLRDGDRGQEKRQLNSRVRGEGASRCSRSLIQQKKTKTVKQKRILEKTNVVYYFMSLVHPVILHPPPKVDAVTTIRHKPSREGNLEVLEMQNCNATSTGIKTGRSVADGHHDVINHQPADMAFTNRPPFFPGLCQCVAVAAEQSAAIINLGA